MDPTGGGQPPDHPMGGPDPPDSGGRKSPTRFTAQQKGKQRADRSIRNRFTEDEARALLAFPPPPPEGGIAEPHAAWVAHPGYRCVMCTNPSCETCPAYGQHRMQGYMDGSMSMVDRRLAAVLYPEVPQYAARMYDSWRVIDEMSREGRERMEADVRYYRDRLDEARDDIRDLRRRLDETEDRCEVRRKIRPEAHKEVHNESVVEGSNRDTRPVNDEYYDLEPDYGDESSDDFPSLPPSAAVAETSFAAVAATAPHSLVPQREIRPQIDRDGLPISRSGWEQIYDAAQIPGSHEAVDKCKAVTTAANRARQERRELTSAQRIALNQWRVPQWLRDEERRASGRAAAAVANNPGYVTHPALSAARANPQIPISITPLSATVEGMPNIRRPGMGPPQSTDPPEKWAVYYHYERRVHAPPAGISDPLNLRQVRGWRTMRVLSPNENSAGASFSRQRTLFHQRFCELLAVPGLYRRILLREHISVTPIANFRPLGGSIDNLTVEAVARHLAECGFSFAWADDCWDFAQAWVTDSRNDGRDLSTVREHLAALDTNLRPAGHPHEPARLVDYMALRPPLCPPSPQAGRPSRREAGLRGNKKRPARSDDTATPFRPRSFMRAQPSPPPTAGPSSTGMINPIPPFTVNAPVIVSTQPPPEPPAPFPGGPTVSLGGIITAPAYFPHHPSRGETTSTSSAAASEIAPSEVPSSVPDEDETMDP
ncbi:hypothetical protein EYR40_006404 [Pleurotus pulmonarius]|nr:hypothetical protein EYR36_011026 [Pleurotus pulmonarius]KAF4599312.1 hypothetical protein EYR40_006404 [Pleurotus pulmonarius]